jgi:predicted RNase H-like HicB family nuclease
MQFEVEVYQNERGEWVATAVEYDVSATGRTENEALARMMDALALHFKGSPRRI